MEHRRINEAPDDNEQKRRCVNEKRALAVVATRMSAVSEKRDNKRGTNKTTLNKKTHTHRKSVEATWKSS
jgi:hypothetical protein